MRSLKCLIVFLVICLTIMTFSAFAEEPLKLDLEDYKVDAGTLKIYFNTSLEQEISADALALHIGNTAIPIKDVSRFEAGEEGVSYLFLVDVSGSMSDKKLTEVKEILNHIAETVTEKDNLSIFLLGNDAYSNPFVATRSEIQSQIEAISRKSSEDTNLYTGIVKGLEVLKTSEKVYAKKCLIVLSDGEDDYTTGITRDEVYQKIVENHIPIFTVAMLEANPSAKKVEASKALGSFARYSPGGIDLVTGLNEATADAIARSINYAIFSSYILHADLSQYQSDGREQVLKLELTAAGIGSTSDSYTITTNTLGQSPEASPLAPSDSVATENPEDQPQADKEAGGHLWVFIAGGALLVVLILVTVLVLNRRKRKKGMSQSAAIIEPVSIPVQEAEPEDHTAQLNHTTLDSHSVQMPEEVISQPQEPDVTVVLTKMDKNNQVYMVDLFGSLIIGRSPSKAGLSFPEDTRLSGMHCSLRFSHNRVLVTDLGSTNGTYVNGVPIQQEYGLEKGDVILIGSMQFRVNW